MKIISIIPLKRGYSTLMDENGSMYRLSNKVISENSIDIGEIDRDLFLNIYHKAREKELLVLTSRYIERKERSEKQLTAYLLQKGFDHEEIEGILSKLKEKKFVDDDRYIREFIDYYKNTKLCSKFFAEQKIIEKVGREKKDLCKQLIKENYTEDEEVDVAKKLIEKKKITEDEEIQKMLASKGFSFKTIISITKNSKNNDYFV